MLKSAYVQAAENSMRIPFVAQFFDKTAENGTDFQRWLASLSAIYQIDRMIALDIPWWNVAATEEVEAFLKDRPNGRAFEYGSGASSAWLAKRCKQLISVEHDTEWCEKISAMLAKHANSRVVHQPISVQESEAYTHAIGDAGGVFDLIVVDGRQRAACLEAALVHLADDGIILFDDSGRNRYRQAIAMSGLEETRYHGRSYCVPYPDYSSILRRPSDAT